MNKKLKLEQLNRVSVSEYKTQKKFPVIVVLDNIRSAYNIGSVFRTADALAIEAIFLCGITAQPPHREIYKTALGASESVDWRYFNNTVDAVLSLKKDNYRILALEQVENSTSLGDFSPEGADKFALVIGNEVDGVQQQVIDLSDSCLEIEQYGTKHSFNVSISAGIALWEIIGKIKKAL